MSDFIDSELLFNSQAFEDLVQDKLQSQGRGELSSVAPLGIYILLKLKPPTWCLQDFSIYINELLQLNTERGRHVFDFLSLNSPERIPYSLILMTHLSAMTYFSYSVNSLRCHLTLKKFHMMQPVILY
jgi:hypothetical protein